MHTLTFPTVSIARWPQTSLKTPQSKEEMLSRHKQFRENHNWSCVLSIKELNFLVNRHNERGFNSALALNSHIAIQRRSPWDSFILSGIPEHSSDSPKTDQRLCEKSPSQTPDGDDVKRIIFQLCSRSWIMFEHGNDRLGWLVLSLQTRGTI